MTSTLNPAEVTVTDEHEPTDDEVEQFRREQLFADGDWVAPEMYPRMHNLSAGFMYRAVIRAEAPRRPEYVTIPQSLLDTKTSLAITQWNALWEAAQFRRRFFDEESLPPPLWDVAEQGDLNVVFVPRSQSRYHEHAPLFHLLPRVTVERFGLPLLRGGQWPFFLQSSDVDRYLPSDFEAKLGRAWASTVWKHLMPGSPISAFSGTDSLRLLAHNLDFWLPAVTEVIQQILRDLPVVKNGVPEEAVHLEDGSVLEGAVAANPRMGSELWLGEADAADVVQLTVEQADTNGQLRGILDALRSNRVEDDFSSRWSYAREDFERRLYRKRAKVQVRFVELTDTIPVQGPEAEVQGRLVTADFLALLDPRDRQIVVLLNSGTTNLTEVGQALGYSNHSAVSKRLARIRTQAADFFDTL